MAITQAKPVVSTHGKHSAFRGLWRFLLGGLLAVCALVTQAATPVLLIATSELPPYVSAKPQDSFLTDLLPLVAREMGVRFEFRFMPWPRCELAVEDQQVWATMPYVPTPERDKKFLFSDPLYAKRTVLFYYSDNAGSFPHTFEHLDELKGLKIGGVRGYYYEELFTKAGLQLDLANSEELSFKKLRAGRVDMAPAVEPVGWDVIRKGFPAEEQANFKVLDTPLSVGHNYLMTSRDYPDTERLLARFNDALAKLRRTGVYQQVAERHGIAVVN